MTYEDSTELSVSSISLSFSISFFFLGSLLTTWIWTWSELEAAEAEAAPGVVPNVVEDEVETVTSSWVMYVVVTWWLWFVLGGTGGGKFDELLEGATDATEAPVDDDDDKDDGTADLISLPVAASGTERNHRFGGKKKKIILKY